MKTTMKVVAIIVVAFVLNAIVIVGGRRLVSNAMHKYYKAGDAVTIGGVTFEVTDVDYNSSACDYQETVITEQRITETVITEELDY